MLPIEVDNRKIGPGAPAFIIAETGANHNGSLETAKVLVDQAAEAGADAVKFRFYNTAKLFREGETDDRVIEVSRDMELSLDDCCILKSHCVERGIMFLATPFDKKSADDLEGMGVAIICIDSGEITNLPLLRHIAKKGKPVILSTGLSYLGEVDQAVGAMRREGCHRIVLLHGAASFPAEAPDINLRAMSVITASLRLPVGLLDHTPHKEIPMGAVAVGACVIQKSLTLDRAANGAEHASSLDPDEFKDMVERLRNLERAMGDGIKKPAFSEMDYRENMRRSLALARSLHQGDQIGSKDLVALRPARGISPIHEGQIVGKTLRRDLPEGSFIGWGDIE